MCALLAAQAQGPTSYWHFAQELGIKFENYIPQAISSNNLQMTYSCSSISTQDGDLLYFARPITCHNAIGAPVANSANLAGNLQVSHGVIFIPNPANPSIHYLFHGKKNYALNEPGKVHFSTIKRTLNHPLGEMLASEKNVLINNHASTQITAVHHANGKDIWVLFASNFSDSIFAHLVTENGVSLTPVVSTISTGLNYVGTGQFKAAPDGRSLARTAQIIDTVNQLVQVYSLILYEFDDQTGIASNSITLDYPTTPLVTVPLGLEYSSSSKKLYVTMFGNFGNDNLLGLNTTPFDSISIASSIDSIDFYASDNLQMGIDRKIYGRAFFENPNHLYALENPNDGLSNLNINMTAVDVEGPINTGGLPDFISSFFRPAYFDVGNACLGDTVSFFVRHPNPDSIHWDFGDPNSGNLNFSNDLNPRHFYAEDGVFTATLTLWADSTIDTFSREIVLTLPPSPIDLGDTVFGCTGQPLVLDVDQNNPVINYFWSDSLELSSIQVTQPGNYCVTIYNHCDTINDSIFADFTEPIELALPDTSLCEDETFNTQVSIEKGSSYLWSTGDTNASIVIDTSLSPDLGSLEIWLTASNACGTSSDTMMVKFLPIPDATLPHDSAHCLDQSFYIFHQNADSVNYLWSDSTSEERIRIDSTQSMWLMAENICGVDRDTFNVEFYPEIKIGEDTVICNGEILVLDATWPGANYVWNTGNTGSSINVSETDNYIVTISSSPCQKVESRTVSFSEEACNDSGCKFSIPNVFSPNSDGINDVLKINNTCQDLSFTVFIYNRWGQLVYSQQSTTSAVSWDGTVNGESATEGTYFVVALHSERQTQRTAVSLMR